MDINIKKQTWGNKEMDHDASLQLDYVMLKESVLSHGRWDTQRVGILYEDLDLYIELFTVLRNAKKLGVGMSSLTLYKYPFPSGGYMIGDYKEGMFLCLYQARTTFSSGLEISHMYTLSIGEKDDVDIDRLEVWPPPSE